MHGSCRAQRRPSVPAIPPPPTEGRLSRHVSAALIERAGRRAPVGLAPGRPDPGKAPRRVNLVAGDISSCPKFQTYWRREGYIGDALGRGAPKSKIVQPVQHAGCGFCFSLEDLLLDGRAPVVLLRPPHVLRALAPALMTSGTLARDKIATRKSPRNLRRHRMTKGNLMPPSSQTGASVRWRRCAACRSGLVGVGRRSRLRRPAKRSQCTSAVNRRRVSRRREGGANGGTFPPRRPARSCQEVLTIRSSTERNETTANPPPPPLGDSLGRGVPVSSRYSAISSLTSDSRGPENPGGTGIISQQQTQRTTKAQ